STTTAAECHGEPDALGTSRVLTVNPLEYPHVGTNDFAESLPLEDHEVVLTFDDGPIAPYTSRVLDALASQCVKATFFMVGSMAKANPSLAKRVHAEGHTIGTHTQHHAHLRRLRRETAKKEIADGIASVTAAVGDTHAVAPFFRFPYLEESRTSD